MPSYPLTWITANIAVGRAPMSYEELAEIRSQGIDAVVNLCGEYSDLHELEEQAGFEVYWLPIADESAPPLEELEKGLEWLDEAVYLGKKVLIHCRFGMGRTGTFITAYLLRRGFALKKAGRLLKPTTANPTNFSQWWLLRKYGRKEGPLKITQPRPENRDSVDLSSFFARYEELLARVEALAVERQDEQTGTCCQCARQDGCDGCFSLDLIEALYLNSKMNIALSQDQRRQVIARSLSCRDRGNDGGTDEPDGVRGCCPLHQDDFCLLHRYRPIRCRLRGFPGQEGEAAAINEALALLSRDVFTALFDQVAVQAPPLVDFRDCLSGRFIQDYFQFLLAQGKMDED